MFTDVTNFHINRKENTIVIHSKCDSLSICIQLECLTDGHVSSKEEEGVTQRGHTVLASSLCM